MTHKRKVLVCGGRDYVDEARIDAVMKAINPDCVVTGGAKGADNLAEVWALAHGIEVRSYPADWRTHGRAAGPLRNAAMLNAERDGLAGGVAFPGGAGTADMVRRLRAAGVAVLEVRR